MLKFPYGISDFQQIIDEDYFYVDRTHFIPILEDAGKQILFLRPRRFGKSLWLSTLINYYDVALADQFEARFGRLAIGKNPTSLHNRYFVLKFDFSGIQTYGTVAETATQLYDHINSQIADFVARYREIITYPITIDPDNALSSFQSLLTAVQITPYRLYLFIDEYDNFANEVLMSTVTDSRHRYEDLVKGEGVFRTLFKVIKSASSGRGLDRAFITGVTPVVLSDMASAYNVAVDVHFYPEFNALCGFNEEEVRAALHSVASEIDLLPEKEAEALHLMRTYYDGYRFTARQSERVYNPTLTLYFLSALQKSGEYPYEMLDSNLSMDRNWIAYIAQMGGAEKLITAVLDETEPLTSTTLAQRFGIIDMLYYDKSTEFLASLLYYLGVLTLNGRNILQKYILQIPNLVVRQLYVDRLYELFLPKSDDQMAGKRSAEILFQSGDLQPLCQFVEQSLFSIFDNRDYLAANELTIKTAFLTVLFNDHLYMVDSEAAIQRTYADLILMRRPDLRNNPILHDLLFEFKYVKLSEISLKDGKGKSKPMSGAIVRRMSADEISNLPEVQNKLKEARTQLNEYRQTLQIYYDKQLRLRAYAVVSLGFERLVWEAY